MDSSVYARVSRFTMPKAALNPAEQAVVDGLISKLAPYVWVWYEAHKDTKVTKIFGIYTVTIGSFGIAALIITQIFGSQPATDSLSRRVR
jgi:hypothetical protein